MKWLIFILDLCKFIIDLSKKGSFCQKALLFLFIAVVINSGGIYYLFKKDQGHPSNFDITNNDQEVNEEIKKALVECGDLSFITWSVLEDVASSHGKFLSFKTVYSCDKDRTRFQKNGQFKCIVDIKFNNPLYLGKHFINKETLDFIESDPKLPNGTKFEELTPVWFSLVNEKGQDSKEALFLKDNTGMFWNIINKTNLRLGELGVIKVRHKNKFGKPVIYIITVAFLPSADSGLPPPYSERKCLRAGNYLMSIAKTSIKGLE